MHLSVFEDPPTGRITDAVIASISRRFPSLRVLYLHQCVDITDAALPHLACLPQLRELTISGCDVTFAGLSVLSDTLESLDFLRRSPHIWGIYCSSCKHLEKSAIFWHCYREFENDHLQCHHPAMQSMAWHVPESELRELPPAAISALGVKFET